MPAFWNARLSAYCWHQIFPNFSSCHFRWWKHISAAVWLYSLHRLVDYLSNDRLKHSVRQILLTLLLRTWTFPFYRSRKKKSDNRDLQMAILVGKAIITLVDLLTSGDLDLGRKVTKIILCTPWYIIYHPCKFEVIPSIGLGGVRADRPRPRPRQTHTHSHTHTHTDAFSVLR